MYLIPLDMSGTFRKFNVHFKTIIIWFLFEKDAPVPVMWWLTILLLPVYDDHISKRRNCKGVFFSIMYQNWVETYSGIVKLKKIVFFDVGVMIS